MAEPALAPRPAHRPAARKPPIPHPHLAPAKPLVARTAPLDQAGKAAQAAAPRAATESWTPAAVPMARPAGWPRRRSRMSPAEKTLRNALRFGFFVNGAALLIPRLFPAGAGWRYGGDDFLLAAAVLVSGQALLMLGRSAQSWR